MRLAKVVRRFYNFRHRLAQLNRPHCCLSSVYGIDEDGYFYISFSCLTHELTTWRETYELQTAVVYGSKKNPGLYPGWEVDGSVCTVGPRDAVEAAFKEAEEACDSHEGDSVTVVVPVGSGETTSNSSLALQPPSQSAISSPRDWSSTEEEGEA